MRLLLLSTTTGYQLRAFGEAAARLGIELVFATDRCHTLDDPWRDGAVAGAVPRRGRLGRRDRRGGARAADRRRDRGRRSAGGAGGARRRGAGPARPSARRRGRERATSGSRASASPRPGCRCPGSSLLPTRRRRADRIADGVRVSGRRQAARAVGQPRRHPRRYAAELVSRVRARSARCWRGRSAGACGLATSDDLLVEGYIRAASTRSKAC